MRKRILAALLAGMLFAPTAHAQPTLSRTDLETVLAPNPIVRCDIDNDSDVDLIVASQSAQLWLGVHRNNGDGTFAAPLFTQVLDDASGGITDLAVGDLDQDGNLDLVVSHYSSWTIYIYYGNGDGTFVAPSTITNANNISAIVLADFSGDGWLDIGTVINADDATVGIFRSMSSGHAFATPVHYPCGIHARGMEVGDLNNDSEVDVLVANWQDAKFSVLLGNGTGGLDPYTQYSLPNWSYGLALANIVGDSNLDVAVTVTDYQGSTGSSIRQVRIYQGDGTGALVLTDSIPTAGNPLGIEVAQLDDDPALDLVWTCGDDHVLQFSTNSNGNGFSLPVDYPTATEPFSLAIADFDENGKLDIAVTARSTQLICLYYNASPVVCIDADFDGFGDPGHPENECAEDNCPNTFNPDQADWNNDGLGDACTPTDTGTNVVVQTTATTTITFDSVNTGGTTGTTITTNGPVPPVNFGVVPLGVPQYVNIYSTVAFGGQITITVAYNPNDLVGPEDSLQLLHFENNLWVDITVSRDTAANTISGVTTSLSPFALVEQCCRGGLRGNVDCSHDGSIDIADLTRLVDYLFITFAPLCCSGQANVDGTPDGHADISDLTALVDYLYINFTPPTQCE